MFPFWKLNIGLGNIYVFHLEINHRTGKYLYFSLFMWKLIMGLGNIYISLFSCGNKSLNWEISIFPFVHVEITQRTWKSLCFPAKRGNFPSL